MKMKHEITVLKVFQS